MASLQKQMEKMSVSNMLVTSQFREQRDNKNHDPDYSESEDEEQRPPPPRRSTSRSESLASSRSSSRSSRADDASDSGSMASLGLLTGEEDDRRRKTPAGTPSRFPQSNGRPTKIRKEVQTMTKAIVNDLNDGMTVVDAKKKYASVFGKTLTLDNTPFYLADGIKMRDSFIIDDEAISMNATIRDLKQSVEGEKFIDEVKGASVGELNSRLELVQIDILQSENRLKDLRTAKKVLQYHLAGRTDVDVAALDVLLSIWRNVLMG
jgi:hypothetical protein